MPFARTDLKGHIFEQHSAAKKFGLDDLKKACEVCMCEDLTPEGAVKAVDLAEAHGVPCLRKKGAELIAEGWDGWMGKDEGVREALEKHPRLAVDVIDALFKIRNNKMEETEAEENVTQYEYLCASSEN